jgi:hypothetical protein
MSIQEFNRIWDKGKAEGSALLVLLALADIADDEGYCWPKIDTLSRRARISSRQVSTIVEELCAIGEIARIVGVGRGRPSLYVILSGLDDETKLLREKGLRAKQEEIMQKLHGLRSKKAQKAKKFHENTSGNSTEQAEKVQGFHENPLGNSADDAEKVKSFHEMATDESGDLTPNDTLSHHVLDSNQVVVESTTVTAQQSGQNAEQSAEQKYYPQSFALLTQAGCTSPARIQAAKLPPERVAAIIANTHASSGGPGAIIKNCLAELKLPLILKQQERNYAVPQRTMGPGRGRAPEAQQLSTDRPQRSELSQAELDELDLVEQRERQRYAAEVAARNAQRQQRQSQSGSHM